MFRKAMYFIPVIMILKVNNDFLYIQNILQLIFIDVSLCVVLIKITVLLISTIIKKFFFFENKIDICSNIKYMLRQLQKTFWSEQPLVTRQSIIDYIGSHFRTRLQRPSWHTNAEVARYLIDNYILIHLKTDKAKFHMLMFVLIGFYLSTKSLNFI